jgi:hypothetical protein
VSTLEQLKDCENKPEYFKFFDKRFDDCLKMLTPNQSELSDAIKSI